MHSKVLLTLALALLPVAPPISLNAQDAESAEAFLEATYRQYGHDGKGPDLWGPKAEIFHSSLLRLIRADEKANQPDQAGALDGDPICSCQDWDGIYDLKIDVKPPTGRRTQASVGFYPSSPQQRTARDLRNLTFTLAAEPGQWRIYDILDRSDPSHPGALRQLLQQDIDTLSQAPKATSAR
jgi:hypothetical protein